MSHPDPTCDYETVDFDEYRWMKEMILIYRGLLKEAFDLISNSVDIHCDQKFKRTLINHLSKEKQIEVKNSYKDWIESFEREFRFNGGDPRKKD